MLLIRTSETTGLALLLQDWEALRNVANAIKHLITHIRFHIKTTIRGVAAELPERCCRFKHDYCESSCGALPLQEEVCRLQHNPNSLLTHVYACKCVLQA